jgi:hypothetical protein
MYVLNLPFYLFSEGPKRGLHNIDDAFALGQDLSFTTRVVLKWAQPQNSQQSSSLCTSVH